MSTVGREGPKLGDKGRLVRIVLSGHGEACDLLYEFELGVKALQTAMQRITQNQQE